MGRARRKSVLFLCTGNYYRSRFAEALFEAVAGKMGLSWQALSRGLALERGAANVGPVAPSVVQALVQRNISHRGTGRAPEQAVADDLGAVDLIVALSEAEHRPLLQERFP